MLSFIDQWHGLWDDIMKNQGSWYYELWMLIGDKFIDELYEKIWI